MSQRNKRILLLALIMASLVALVSFTSAKLLYDTSIDEQRKRLQELVRSQAALIQEMNLVNIDLAELYGTGDAQALTFRQLAHAHQELVGTNKSGEFTVARRVGNTIRFIIVNGHMVAEHSDLKSLPMDSGVAEPMVRALAMQTGTTIGRDYRGKDVLAAFEPLILQGEILGIVAKIDIDEIKAPFVSTNLLVAGVGLGFLLLAVFIFYRATEPLLRELKTSEEQYRDLVEGAKSIIVRVDNRGRILFANTFAQEYLGYRMDELFQSDACSILVKPDGSLSCRDGTEDLFFLLKGGDEAREVPVKLASGSTAWISWAVHPVKDNAGNVVEMLCIGNDVTSRHLAQRAQREIEERFRGIAKASPVGILITDISGNLLYANEKMHELTGLGAVELAGTGWIKSICPENRDDIRKDWFANARGGMLRSEFRLIGPENSEVWILGQRVPLKNTAGNLIGFVATLTDITRIKETEAQHRRLSTAIAQAAEGVVITDTQGAITYVNPAFEAITGYSIKEAVGNNPRILKSGEHDADFYADLWETIISGGVWHGTFINRRKNGEIYHQESSIGPVRDESGRTVSYVGVIRDVSKQLMLEAQLRQAQKLESIGELAAGIAHEINTPTQYVDNNVRFMEASFKTLMDMAEASRKLVEALNQGSDEATLRQLAEQAVDAEELQYLAEDVPNAVKESLTGLKRIAEIVQSIKQLAHPGEMEMSFHDLNHIIRNSITVSTNEWKYAADITTDLQEDLPPVCCMVGELGQVLLNLIVNAAHAIQASRGENPEEKGTISIRSHAEEHAAVIEVSDNGCGMPPKVVARAFDPFFTTKEVGKGTGQGLAIAHNVVVTKHGGSIDVETKEGAGTTFTVKIPFEPAVSPNHSES